MFGCELYQWKSTYFGNIQETDVHKAISSGIYVFSGVTLFDNGGEIDWDFPRNPHYAVLTSVTVIGSQRSYAVNDPLEYALKAFDAPLSQLATSSSDPYYETVNQSNQKNYQGYIIKTNKPPIQKNTRFK